jgi:hypothetical protein
MIDAIAPKSLVDRPTDMLPYYSSLRLGNV